MNRYLLASADESIRFFEPCIVLALSEQGALHTYLRKVYSKDNTFRESVLDLAVNMTFVERFYLSTDQENYHFNEAKTVVSTAQQVEDRVKVFFETQPILCDRFLRYMKTSDVSLIDDEMYEFIAVSEKSHGFCVINLDSLEII